MPTSTICRTPPYISVEAHIVIVEVIVLGVNVSKEWECWFPFVLALRYPWPAGRVRRVFIHFKPSRINPGTKSETHSLSPWHPHISIRVLHVRLQSNTVYKFMKSLRDCRWRPRCYLNSNRLATGYKRCKTVLVPTRAGSCRHTRSHTKHSHTDKHRLTDSKAVPTQVELQWTSRCSITVQMTERQNHEYTKCVQRCSTHTIQHVHISIAQNMCC